jgi:Flp pilus assembly protein TadD
MKFAVGCFLSLAFGLSVTCLSSADDLSQGYARVKPALVKVWAFNAHGLPVESGTGFVVLSDAHRSWIVTALHVVTHASKVTVDVSRDVRDVPAVVVAKTSEQHDIVLLRIARGNMRAVHFAPRSNSMVEGDFVAAAGYFKYDERIGVSGQLPQLVGPGTIGALPDDGKFMEVNLDLEPGLSGAPLFDPGSGDVVGVLDTKSSIGHGGYAVSAPLIVLDFLAAHHVAVNGTPAAVTAVAVAPPKPAPVAAPPKPAPVTFVALPAPTPPPAPALVPPPATPQASSAVDGDLALLHQRGHAHNVQGQYDLAIADLTQAIDLDPNDAVAYNDRAYAYVGKGRFDLAVADLTQALRVKPDYLVAYYNRGSAYTNNGQYDLAIADLTQALRIDPNYTIAYNRRGYDYIMKGQYNLAIADLTRAVSLNANYALAYANRGTAYTGQGRYYLAIADYTQAVRIDPSLARAYTGRGEAYEKVGRDDLAMADYTSALRIDPNERSQILRVSALYAR